MRNKQPILLCLLLLAAAASYRCGGSAEPGGPKAVAADPAVLDVKAAAVQAGEWTVTVLISGSLRSRSIVEVRPEVGGRLMSAGFDDGDFVREGDLLAEIDPANYRLAVEQARAVLGVAQAGRGRAQIQVEHARREKERADNLLRSGGITSKDQEAAVTGVRDAEAQVHLAEAQVDQARAALAIAEKALQDCRIVAPSSGLVHKRYSDPGSLLSAGAPLYMLVDNSQLELECLVPSYRLAEVRTGLQVEFTTPSFGDRMFQGTITAVNPMVESDNRSVKVNARITNPKGELRSGMYARGTIVIRKVQNAPVVPRQALLVESEESTAGSLYVVDKNRASRRQVQIGGIQEGRVWIREGVSSGDVVIVEVGPELKDGSQVRYQSSAPERGR
jgi:membrane fusion protein, multidrug efflux system